MWRNRPHDGDCAWLSGSDPPVPLKLASLSRRRPIHTMSGDFVSRTDWSATVLLQTVLPVPECSGWEVSRTGPDHATPLQAQEDSDIRRLRSGRDCGRWRAFRCVCQGAGYGSSAAHMIDAALTTAAKGRLRDRANRDHGQGYGDRLSMGLAARMR